MSSYGVIVLQIIFKAASDQTYFNQDRREGTKKELMGLCLEYEAGLYCIYAHAYSFLSPFHNLHSVPQVTG